jgi:predicted Ser/Thr protein kinase
MPSRTGPACPQRGTTEQLARGCLDAVQRASAQRHLEECDACRRRFRELTADQHPRLRNYTILERIGEGGFGVVYKVIHHGKQRTEALKMLFAKTPRRVEYFENEVHLAARLKHPNIATVYEAHLGAPPFYYTMEYVEGRPIDEYFRAQHVSLPDRIRILQTVARAVGYAHRRGVVHRDLKPANIMIDADGQPHILDFGISTRLSLDYPQTTRGRSEGLLGTFGYMAPEQISGGPVDERADIYALGALIYHCVTGEPAQFASKTSRLERLLRERQIARAADLAAIIARCVEKLPERRYPDCYALAEDLENYLAGRPVHAAESGTAAYQLLRTAALVLRQRPLLVRSFAVLCSAALLALAGWTAAARWYPAASGPQQLVLIAVSPSLAKAIADRTVGQDLPGLSPSNRKSWRMLYGLLLERLAQVAPTAVAFDFYFPDCQPSFDHYFIAGLQAMRAAGIPVIIGTRDLDINSDPVVCESILDACHSCAMLAAAPPERDTQDFILPACVQRGFAPPVPGLALSVVAAARHPDAVLDLHLRRNTVVLRYRKATARTGQPRWYPESDAIECGRVYTLGDSQMLRAGDRFYPLRVPKSVGSDPALAQVNLEQVLVEDLERLRRQFAGRVVIVGLTIPGTDEYDLADGRKLFGCQIQARAVERLLAGGHARRLEWSALGLIMLFWAALGGAIASAVPQIRRLSLGAAGIAAVGGVVVGAALVYWGAQQVHAFWSLQAVLGTGGLLAAAAPVYWVRLVRERQIELSPEPVWESEPQTLSSTLLQTTSASTSPTPARPVG